jgi:hypothetical protein
VCVCDIVLFHSSLAVLNLVPVPACQEIEEEEELGISKQNLDLLLVLLVVLKCSTAVLNLSTTVLLAARKSRMLELLAIDKKSIF